MSVKTSDLARLYDVTPRTIRNWQKKQAPFHDPVAMNIWIAAQRSRFAVSKYTKKHPEEIVAAQSPDQIRERMENVIWRAHMMLVALRTNRPELREELSPILAVTSPIVADF